MWHLEGCNAMSPRRLANLAVIAAPGMRLDDVRDRLVASTLKFTDGNKSAAAHLLGVAPKTIYRWTKSEERTS